VTYKCLKCEWTGTDKEKVIEAGRGQRALRCPECYGKEFEELDEPTTTDTIASYLRNLANSVERGSIQGFMLDWDGSDRMKILIRKDDNS
jgi:DNA-directed RNA polymerase subunit RPC12/RpoP